MGTKSSKLTKTYERILLRIDLKKKQYLLADSKAEDIQIQNNMIEKYSIRC